MPDRGTLRPVMLRLLVTIPQILVASLAGYNAVTALWGWKNRPPAVAAHPRRVRVVVPAHNEATVIANLVGDLGAQTHPPDATDIVVVADRCTDDTVAMASPARVVERHGGTEGKGPSLAWYLDSEPLDPDEILLVIDADNRIPRNLLERVSDEIAAGHSVVQVYLDSTNPSGSAMAMAYAMSYWAGNRMVQLARSNLGWSADLGGTGMAFTAAALASVGGFGDGLTEDQELGARLALDGTIVEWLHDVRIYDEKPTDASSAVRQRARWMAGRRQVARTYIGKLWRAAIEQRSGRLFDVGIRLVQPGRSFIALLSGSFAFAAFCDAISPAVSLANLGSDHGRSGAGAGSVPGALTVFRRNTLSGIRSLRSSPCCGFRSGSRAQSHADGVTAARRVGQASSPRRTGPGPRTRPQSNPIPYDRCMIPAATMTL